MKKQILLIFILSCISIAAQQTKFGAKAGYSLSTISVKSDEGKLTYDSKSSFYVGALAEHSLNEKFSLQVELLYSIIGGTYRARHTILSPEQGTIEVNVEDKYSYGTIQIPVLGKYYIFEKFAITTGLNLGAIVSAKSNYKDSSGAEKEKNIKNIINTFYIAPLFGLEYNFTNNVFIDARYNIGISNISKIPISKQTDNFFQIGIGYKFN